MLLSVATLNVGLFEILGGLVQPVPWLDQRLGVLPAAIRNMGTDLVALQEIYSLNHRDYLLQAVSDVYPFYGPARHPSTFGLKNGLLTLSSRVMCSMLVDFEYALPVEDCFDNKGFLVCRLKFDRSTEIVLINTHMTAGGGLFHPQSSRTERVRTKQMGQVLEQAKQEQSSIVIICGDLNAGPEVSRCNYLQLQEAGFVDAYLAAKKSGEESTWDPQNLLNQHGPYKRSPPQRVDHVFVRNKDLRSGALSVVESSIASKEEVVPIPRGGKVTLSDHYSVCVWFEIEDK